MMRLTWVQTEDWKSDKWLLNFESPCGSELMLAMSSPNFAEMVDMMIDAWNNDTENDDE